MFKKPRSVFSLSLKILALLIALLVCTVLLCLEYYIANLLESKGAIGYIAYFLIFIGTPLTVAILIAKVRKSRCVRTWIISGILIASAIFIFAWYRPVVHDDINHYMTETSDFHSSARLILPNKSDLDACRDVEYVHVRERTLIGDSEYIKLTLSYSDEVFDQAIAEVNDRYLFHEDGGLSGGYCLSDTQFQIGTATYSLVNSYEMTNGTLYSDHAVVIGIDPVNVSITYLLFSDGSFSFMGPDLIAQMILEG